MDKTQQLIKHSFVQLSARQIGRFLALLLIVCGATTAGVFAQESGQSAGVSPEEITADEVNEVAREIWCPLCSGVRLDSCELKACDQMKDVIAIKLSEGEDTESIKNYFLEQYGPQILGEPPREGFNWLAWILPFAALIGGGFFLWNKTRWLVRGSNASDDAETTTNRRGDSETDAEMDDYERKLEEELARYG